MSRGSDELEVKLADDFSESRSSHPSVGCLNVPTPKGAFHVHDGDLSMCIKMDHPTGERSVALLVCSSVAPTNTVQGLVSQFTPRAARAFAASMLDVANQIDGGRADG